jgi:hypothetical protein
MSIGLTRIWRGIRVLIKSPSNKCIGKGNLRKNAPAVISTKRISTKRTKRNLASRSPIRRAVRTGAARPAVAQTVALLLIASWSLKARATRQMIVAAFPENTAKRKTRARIVARRIASQARKISARTRTKAKIKVKRSPRSLSEPLVPKVKSSLGVAY